MIKLIVISTKYILPYKKMFIGSRDQSVDIFVVLIKPTTPNDLLFRIKEIVGCGGLN